MLGSSELCLLLNIKRLLKTLFWFSISDFYHPMLPMLSKYLTEKAVDAFGAPLPVKPAPQERTLVSGN